jgi:predicted P-loop ATPase
MEALACKLWGQPNRALSSRTELRFGRAGSKSLKLPECVFFDHEANFGGGYRELYKLVHGRYPRNGEDASPGFAALARKQYPRLGKPVEWWDYRDAAGNVIARAVRFEPPGSDKTFRQCRPDSEGGWRWSLQGIQIPLYRLPDLLSASADATVFITEGERKADALHRWGLLATCNCMGAKKFRAHHAETLAGRKCVLLGDNDEAGREHVRRVAHELRGAGVRFCLVELPGLEEKGDILNWINAGHTKAELLALVDEAWKKAAPVTAEDEAPRQRRRPLNVLGLVTFIGNQPEWKDALRLNHFTESMEVRDPFPPNSRPALGVRRFSEPGDVLEAMLYFQGSGFPKAGKNLTWDTLSTVAHRNAYHPVRDYLHGLRWDGVPRLGRLFPHYFNAELPPETDLAARDKVTAYLEHVGRCWMVSAVARVMQPGCKVDHLPVLVGAQGVGKSKAIRALCSDPGWFSDDLSPDLTQRDTKDSLVGKWIVELAEMPHVRKEVERVKAFFSRQTDRYRRAYDRLTNDWPRQCVFIGSSNDLEFIDATGNRRFWPVEVAGIIDIARIVADRDQLWAEAVHLYRGGLEWWLPPNIERIAAEQQERFAEEDIWTGFLGRWIDDRTYQGKVRPFTLTEAMMGCLGFTDAKQIDKTEQGRAARCLKTLRFKHRRFRFEGKRDWWWSQG